MPREKIQTKRHFGICGKEHKAFMKESLLFSHRGEGSHWRNEVFIVHARNGWNDNRKSPIKCYCKSEEIRAVVLAMEKNEDVGEDPYVNSLKGKPRKGSCGGKNGIQFYKHSTGVTSNWIHVVRTQHKSSWRSLGLTTETGLVTQRSLKPEKGLKEHQHLRKREMRILRRPGMLYQTYKSKKSRQN